MDSHCQCVNITDGADKDRYSKDWQASQQFPDFTAAEVVGNFCRVGVRNLGVMMAKLPD